MASILQSRIAGYLWAVLGIAAVTAICASLHEHLTDTTVALAFLLVVLFVAMRWGVWPGRIAAALGVLCFHFFFLPRIDTLAISGPQEWVALAAFFITASTVGHLSTRERKRAAEAEAGRKAARLLARLQAVVAELGQMALRSEEVGKVLEEAVALVARTLNVDYCNVMELLPGGEELILRAGVGWKEGLVGRVTVKTRDSQPGFVIRSDRPVIVEDAAMETRFVLLPRLLGEDVASAMSVVISTSDGPYGALGVHSRLRRMFTGDEVHFLQAVANVLGTMIERRRAQEALQKSADEIRTLNAELEQRVTARTAELQAANKLKDELILRERGATAELEAAREREVEIGFRIQQNLLLDQPPADVPGLRVAALTVPSQRIDGDFYIFIRHQNQSLDVIVGDVMGKGIPAALLGAATKSHFLKALSDLMALSKDGKLPEPREVAMLAHAGVVRHLIELDSFVTLCYARLNVSTRSLELVDCGHTGILQMHHSTGLCEVWHGDNLPMGVREGEIYDQISIPFEPGDLLLLYSDGITEARNPARELFGVGRLQECVRSNGHLEPAALVEAIRKAIFAFSKSDRLADDLTSVAIRVEETKLLLARNETEIQSDLKQLRRARQFVRAFCHSLPGSPLHEDSTSALELAVNEAASNIMKHAYHGRTDQGIHLDAEAFSGHVVIRLRHLGDPFDPSAAPPPVLDGSRQSGFGAYIITQSVDEVRYYRDERGRNCIALTKLRNP